MAGALSIKPHLHFNVKYTSFSLICHVLHSLYACAIKIASELRVLNESIFIHQFYKLLLWHEIVCLSMLFPGPWRTGCVRDRKSKPIRIF